jgi:hypothetical protein
MRNQPKDFELEPLQPFESCMTHPDAIQDSECPSLSRRASRGERRCPWSECSKPLKRAGYLRYETSLFSVLRLTEYNYRKHANGHLSQDNRKFACSICPKKFLYPKDRERHFCAMHGDPGTISHHFCPELGCKRAKQGFIREDKLKEHIRNMHPNRHISDENLELPGIYSRKSAASHICPVKSCERSKSGSGFSSPHDLRRHKASKHGDAGTVYRCTSASCLKRDKVWTRMDNFRQHIKKHQDDPETLIKR